MTRFPHRQIRNQIQDSIDYPLPAEVQAQLDAHLAGCASCQSYGGQVRGLETDLRRVMQARWGGKTGKFSSEAILPQLRRHRMQNMIWNSVKVLGVVALSVVLVIAAGSLFRLQGPSPSTVTATGVTTSTPAATEAQASPAFLGSGKPADGEWTAGTNFGQLIFTIGNTGTRIKKVDYLFSKWTCGDTTINASEVVDATDWLIIDNQFTAYSTFDKAGQFTIEITGAYEAANQKLSGDWMAAVSGTVCTGTWEASAPIQATP
jgi:Putative zinc-finger